MYQKTSICFGRLRVQLQQKNAFDKTIINCICGKHFKHNRKGWSLIKIDIHAMRE
jgi:acetone carboxylase gamma subunit